MRHECISWTLSRIQSMRSTISSHSSQHHSLSSCSEQCFLLEQPCMLHIVGRRPSPWAKRSGMIYFATRRYMCCNLHIQYSWATTRMLSVVSFSLSVAAPENLGSHSSRFIGFDGRIRDFALNHYLPHPRISA